MSSRDTKKFPNGSSPPVPSAVGRYTLFDPVFEGHSIDIPKLVPLKIENPPLPKIKRSDKFSFRALQPVTPSSPIIDKIQIPKEFQTYAHSKILKFCTEKGFIVNPTASEEIEKQFFIFIINLISDCFSNACRRVGRGADSAKRAVTYSPFISNELLRVENQFLYTFRERQYCTDQTLSQYILKISKPFNLFNGLDFRSIENFQKSQSVLKCMNNVIALHFDREEESKAATELKTMRDKKKAEFEDTKKVYNTSCQEHIMELKKTQEFENGKKNIVLLPKDILFSLKTNPDYEQFYNESLMLLNTKHDNANNS